MVLSGTPKLGNYMILAEKPGAQLGGEYFDIWMCPTKDLVPGDTLDMEEFGECVSVTNFNRRDVAGWVDGASPQTVALGLEWLLADEDVPAINSTTEALYRDSGSQPLSVGTPDAEGAGSWCSFADWFMIAIDYNDFTVENIGHSNWSEAFSAEGCPEGSGGSGSSGAGSLPDTGASSTAGIVAGSLGLAAIAGGVLLVRARRLRTNGN
jgi:LPXTG-motif cell wall-anchored protein